MCRRRQPDQDKYAATHKGHRPILVLSSPLNVFISFILRHCSSVLLFLNDETLDSRWVKHELSMARQHNIPIIVMGECQFLSCTDLMLFLSADYTDSRYR